MTHPPSNLTLPVHELVPQRSNHIDGRWVPGSGGEGIDVLNPATGDVLQTVARGTDDDIAAAVGAAHRAFPAWRDMNPTRRGELLQAWADLITQRQEQLSLLASLEGGQPYRVGEGAGLARRLRYYASQADKLTGLTLPTTGPEYLAYTLREPYGVCGVIVPWNSPVGMMLNGGAAALAAGNTIVVKPSEDAPLACLLVASMASEAGIPDGVVNVVTGFGGEAGAALTRHPLVRHMTFTGSPETGQRVMAGCAESLIPLHLELGGKSPMIAFDDAPIDRLARTIAESITDNAGQVCYSGTRIVVSDAIRADVVAAVADQLAKVRIGPWHEDVDMGPVVSARQLDRVRGYVELGVAEGARLAFGGGVPHGERYERGHFLEPTLFDDVDSSMRIAQEEIFGPVLVVQPFGSTEEAVEIANSTRYGLVASVWTNDARRVQSLTRRIEAGQVYVNTHGHRGAIGAPFGGYKHSGFGRSGGIDTIQEYLQTKTVIQLG